MLIRGRRKKAVGGMVIEGIAEKIQYESRGGDMEVERFKWLRGVAAYGEEGKE